GAAGQPDTYYLKYSITMQSEPVVPPDPGHGGGGGGGGAPTLQVNYVVPVFGSTKDAVLEPIAKLGDHPKAVPTVTADKGHFFLGWAETPDDITDKKDPKIVDPKSFSITESKTFYAVYRGTFEHEHYVNGYSPSGLFGPADDITRGQVAAIIARSCLEGFHEDNDYGTGGYGDIDGSHWATSAIAFCTTAGVYVGYDDGNFYPDKPITRQEFALVFARLVGVLKSEGKEIKFTDKGDISNWAVDGIYTAQENGWINGYTDGTFKPKNNIARSEAVKIVNRYLNRGVDEAGIKVVFDKLKQWPDVPESYWAYHEILEAANDHTCYYVDGVKPPENWFRAYVEQAHWGI
ncbi:MAG: S-layer homology domain-containing protein, partial [Oscillospiraceae bacterium]